MAHRPPRQVSLVVRRTGADRFLEVAYNRTHPMLSFRDRSFRLCDGLSRRDVLRVGALAAFGLSLPTLARGRAAAATVGQRVTGRRGRRVGLSCGNVVDLGG